MKTFSKETNRALVQMLSHGYILSPPENNSDCLVTDQLLIRSMYICCCTQMCALLLLSLILKLAVKS